MGTRVPSKRNILFWFSQQCVQFSIFETLTKFSGVFLRGQFLQLPHIICPCLYIDLTCVAQAPCKRGANFGRPKQFLTISHYSNTMTKMGGGLENCRRCKMLHRFILLFFTPEQHTINSETEIFHFIHSTELVLAPIV